MTGKQTLDNQQWVWKWMGQQLVRGANPCWHYQGVQRHSSKAAVAENSQIHENFSSFSFKATCADKNKNKITNNWLVTYEDGFVIAPLLWPLSLWIQQGPCPSWKDWAQSDT